MNTTVEERFRGILLNHNSKDFKFLLAVSGGIDSMVLLDLFRKTNAQFAVAHCNFQLRGDDSLGDEEFVQLYCGKHQIPFHTIRFDVESYQKTGNYSLEMACRNLRYDWFRELMKINHFDYLVTAHHLDDNIETFLINLSRGTGLKGLEGMKILSEQQIFRPLITTSKAEILAYAQTQAILWREDCTNQTDDYTRNKIRHHITPTLKEIHPSFEANFSKTLQYIQDSNQFIQHQVDEIRMKLGLTNEGGKVRISELSFPFSEKFILFQLFERYGFKDVELIKKLKVSANSAEIQSDQFRLIKDREFLILTPIEKRLDNEISVNQDEIKINSLTLKFISSDQLINEALETLDLDEIQYPLKFRKPKIGDYFYPIGMKGQKKLVSKFFKDIKLSKIEKEQAWLLVDALDRVVWVMNYRLDDRFKMKKTSKNFLNIIVC